MPEPYITDADEKLIIEQNPLALVEHGYLTIKTKSDSLAKLELNSVQRIILAIIKKQLKEKKPIRILLLKARQMGVSTLVESILYAMTSQKEGINALVIADDIKGSNYIFEMQKNFQELLEPHLKPAVEHSNEKKLSFAGIHSQVLIDTAENKNAGRKFTIQYCHLSEAAFFPDLESMMLGLSQAVPNNPGTMIIMETTANGVGNAFYERWRKAVEGNSDWMPVFIPWFELPEYRMELVKKEFYPIEGVKGDKTKFLSEEIMLKREYGLSDEQLNWRRWCIVNNCNGDADKYRQEYPASWVEAFLMSGSLFFDRDALIGQERVAEKTKPQIGEIVKLEGRYIFRACEDGRFRAYEMPDKNAQYCIGADSAEGLPHGDDCAAVVLNKKTNTIACVYNVQCDSDEFSEDLLKMGMIYNMAMIAPENKGYGTSVCRNLYKVYGNIFRKIVDKTGVNNVMDELGWNTNCVTRPQMLMQLKEELRERAIRVLDKEILAQMRTFINNPKRKRQEAEAGKKDDLVFALAIAVMVRTYYPYVSQSAIEEARKNRMLARPLTANQGYGFKKG